jgi:hypothetical protein
VQNSSVLSKKHSLTVRQHQLHDEIAEVVMIPVPSPLWLQPIPWVSRLERCAHAAGTPYIQANLGTADSTDHHNVHTCLCLVMTLYDNITPRVTHIAAWAKGVHVYVEAH